MPKIFNLLTSKQLESLHSEKTVFFFPVGPLEDHGPHLPIGLDLMEAEKKCHLAAQDLETQKKDWTGVVMPSAPLGVDSNTSRIFLTVRAHVLRDWLVDSCRALGRIGFRFFVCYSGHAGPRQLTAIEEAGKMVGFSPGTGFRLKLFSADSSGISLYDVLKSPLIPSPDEHGGKRDTSVALVVAPDQVDPLFKTLPEQGGSTSFLAQIFGRLSKKISGYWGAPSLSTSEEGNRILQTSVKQTMDGLLPILNGARPRSTFRTWYSLIPMNRSFFKGWVVLLLGLTGLLVWTYLHIKMLI